jgi:cyclopropane-fatty-acyl-phospholipid synthase
VPTTSKISLEKAGLDALLRRMRHGGVAVTYWDGETRSYGSAPATLQVEIRRSAVVRAMLKNPSLAVGEGYMRGDIYIDEDQLDDFFRLTALNSGSVNALRRFTPWHRNERNHQRRQRSQISRHYDVGNDYYRLFLDEHQIYSCAYYRSPTDTLERAQEQKIAHILRKLKLEPGQRLLDIGCGWGYLAVAAAKQYGVTVLGITLSREQLAGARELAEREGVSDQVRFELINYQELRELPFDRVVSVGMFEHVGQGNQHNYFRAIDRLLKPGGVSVLHTITSVADEPNDPWIDRYIFPGGHLPSVATITTNMLESGMWLWAQEDLCQHYDRTLVEWRRRHRQHKDQIVTMFDEDFYRMRDFWLAGSIAAFRHGGAGLSQFIFTKGKPEPGEPPRTLEHVYRQAGPIPKN